MKCPKCGAFVEEGRSVCFMCGENLAGNINQETIYTQQNQPTQSKESLKLL